MGMSLCRRWMTIGGVDLSEFNCHLLNPGIASSPERDVEVISVPGRSGDLVIDNGRFKNITVEYKCAIDGSNSQYDFERMMAWLKSLTGYQRIEECYHSTYYRMGLFSASVDPEEQNAYQVVFTLRADCKPQKYLLSGDEEKQYTLMALDSTAHEYVSYPFPSFGGAMLYDDQWKTGMTAADWLPALKRVTIFGGSTLTRSQCVAALDLTTGGVDIYAVAGFSGDDQVEIVFDHSGAYAGGYMSLFRYETNYRDPYHSGTHLAIYNPTPYTAKPSIRFFAKNTNGSDQKFMYGEGMAQIEIAMNQYLEDEDAKFIIDSETYNTYIVTASGEILNGNQYVSSLGYYVLPEFEPGQNYVHAYLLTDNTLAAIVYAYVTSRWFIV